MGYNPLRYAFDGTHPIVWRAREFQVATILWTESDRDQNYILGSPHIPGSTVYITMELNDNTRIVTDLERWCFYKRLAAGPLGDGTGGVLHGGYWKLGPKDLAIIKASLEAWRP